MTTTTRSELIAAARANLARAASATTPNQASRILAGEADDERLRLLAQMANELETPVLTADPSAAAREAFPDDEWVSPAINAAMRAAFVKGWAAHAWTQDLGADAGAVPESTATAADVLRGYGHDSVADALIAASQITEAQVRAGAEVLLRDYQTQYDGGTIDEFTDLSREVLATARAS